MRYIFIISLALFFCQTLSAQDYYTIRKNNVLSTKYNEYQAKKWNDGYIYISDQHSRSWVHENDKKGRDFSNIMFKSDGMNHGEQLADMVHSKHHDGPFALTANGNTIYFTRSEIQLKDGFGHEPFGLFYMSLNDSIQEIMKFPFNSNAYSIGHPSFGQGDSVMMLASDRKDGYGNSDLVLSRYEELKWTKPVNIGNEINTEYSENFPFIDKDNNLYFSSNRPGGVGGLDVYKATWNGTNWDDVKCLPEPINSDKDDFGFYIQNGYRGMFSSNREGTDDIFEFEYHFPDFGDCDSLMPADYCFTFFEPNATRFDSLPLIYEWDFGDGVNGYGTTTKHCFQAPGEYLVKLNVLDTITLEIYMEQASYAIPIEELDYPFITSIDTFITNTPIEFNNTGTHIVSFEADRYWWRIADTIHYSGASFSHNFVSEGFHNVAILATSAIDTMGGFQKSCVYKNVFASNDKGVVQMYSKNMKEMTQLIKMEQERTLAEIFYSVQIHLGDSTMAAKSDLLRKAREKYDVTARKENQKRYSYTIGKEGSAQELYPLYIDAHNMGFSDAIVKKILSDSTVNLNNLKNASWRDLDGKKVILSNMNFESNSWEITLEMKNELKKVLPTIDRLSSLICTVIAHTDDKGDEDFNLKLSVKRAREVYDYLLNYGVDGKRIKYMGAGESHPLVANVDDLAREKNRRVELLFTLPE